MGTPPGVFTPGRLGFVTGAKCHLPDTIRGLWVVGPCDLGVMGAVGGGDRGVLGDCKSSEGRGGWKGVLELWE